MRRFACVVAIALCACEAQGNRTGWIVLPGMTYSVPYDSYSRNPVTGPTLRLPPEGTVPYGATPFTYGVDKHEAARAGAELTNPYTSREDLARGKDVFGVFCLVCHGPAGEGDGPIIPRFPNPASLTAPHAKSLPDGQLYHIIYHGQGLMPGYAVQIRHEDRWRAVTYVRSLQNPPPPPATDTKEEPPTGDAQ